MFPTQGRTVPRGQAVAGLPSAAATDDAPDSLALEHRARRQDAMALRVLVGEADPAIADLLQAMLEVAGCEVCVARSGPELVAAAINELPHVIFFEGRLPGMDGWTVCDVLSHVMEDTPLVFLSTQCQTGDFQ